MLDRRNLGRTTTTASAAKTLDARACSNKVLNISVRSRLRHLLDILPGCLAGRSGLAADAVMFVRPVTEGTGTRGPQNELRGMFACEMLLKG